MKLIKLVLKNIVMKTFLINIENRNEKLQYEFLLEKDLLVMQSNTPLKPAEFSHNNVVISMETHLWKLFIWQSEMKDENYFPPQAIQAMCTYAYVMTTHVMLLAMPFFVWASEYYNALTYEAPQIIMCYFCFVTRKHRSFTNQAHVWVSTSCFM